VGKIFAHPRLTIRDLRRSVRHNRCTKLDSRNLFDFRRTLNAGLLPAGMRVIFISRSRGYIALSHYLKVTCIFIGRCVSPMAVEEDCYAREDKANMSRRSFTALYERFHFSIHQTESRYTSLSLSLSLSLPLPPRHGLLQGLVRVRDFLQPTGTPMSKQ